MYTNELQAKKIFIIEDDVVNLAVFNRVLRNSGAYIYQNYNSIGIVTHIIENLPIDLIIIDIMLRRNINGFDVVRELKENSRTKQIPVVAVSSLDPEEAIPQAMKAGCDGFISKPINALTFNKDLQAVLNGQKRWIAN